MPHEKDEGRRSFEPLLIAQAPADQRGVWIDYLEARPALISKPLRQPGRAQVLGWDLEYVSGPALAYAIESLVLYGINNFHTPAERPRILDCGANIGISVLNFKRLFPGAQITAFEPDPEFAPVLRRNLQRNGAEDVEVIEAAVWVEEGNSGWHCEGVDGSKLDTLAPGVSRTCTVPTKDLAPYLSGPVDLIKLDIEGAEYAVVSSLGNRLEQARSMIVECHVHCSDIGPLSSLLADLKTAGFQAAVNTLGSWRDLVRQPAVPTPEHFCQYLLVAAWRDPIPPDLSAADIPAGGNVLQRQIALLEREHTLNIMEAENQATRTEVLALREELAAARSELKTYQDSLLIQWTRKLVAGKKSTQGVR